MKTLVDLKFFKIVQKKIGNVTYYAHISQKDLKVFSIHYEKDGIVGLRKIGKTKIFKELTKIFEMNREIKLKLRSIHANDLDDFNKRYPLLPIGGIKLPQSS